MEFIKRFGNDSHVCEIAPLRFLKTRATDGAFWRGFFFEEPKSTVVSVRIVRSVGEAFELDRQALASDGRKVQERIYREYPEIKIKVR